jgi:hypothetical protein
MSRYIGSLRLGFLVILCSSLRTFIFHQMADYLLGPQIDISIGQILGRAGDRFRCTCLEWITVPSPLPSQADVQALSALLRAADI